MIASHVTPEDLATAARALDVRLENLRPLGRRYQFTLRLNPSKAYQRRGHSGRRVGAVCWHGHRDFFRALFAVNPAAEIRSRWVAGRIHYTSHNFEDTYRDTGSVNIGSQACPLAYQDACVCSVDN